MKSHKQYRDFILLLSITAAALLVEGYHPGVEDDAVYLSAIERRLHPGLYPRDFRFFTLQMQASVFDRMMAGWVRLTHMPVPVAELLGQFLAAFFLLWGCLAIARRCFASETARWAAVGLVGALFTLPVAGTALYIFDQYLHPRDIAAALVVWAVVAVLDRRGVRTWALLAVAVVMHPIMGVLGVSYCVILWIGGVRIGRLGKKPVMATALFGIVPSWIFEGPSPAWEAALNTRTYYFLGRWTWYEWLGAIGPVVILWVMARWARRVDRPVLALVAECGAFYAVFQLAVACVVLLTPGLVRLTPMQPMRYLYMVYLLMAVLGGGLIGEKLLRGHVWRWIALFVPLAAGMFWAQRALFPATVHLELPGRAARNPWVRAFVWVRESTPTNAYFALDPNYMAVPGEDFHSFRALAERSELADAVKDAAVATQVPDLAPAWLEQTQAAAGWEHFRRADFLRLQREFGVDWIVVRGAGVAELSCPYRNDTVAVCRL